MPVDGSNLVKMFQGRSSCMPAHALAPNPGWTILDCCAAPGNKTTHIAAMVGNTGTVMAFDKDKERCELLQRMVTRCRASNVQIRHQVMMIASIGILLYQESHADPRTRVCMALYRLFQHVRHRGGQVAPINGDLLD